MALSDAFSHPDKTPVSAGMLVVVAVGVLVLLNRNLRTITAEARLSV